MQRAPAPWHWQIDGRSLIIHLPQPHQVLSWASLGGGARRAGAIVNHQVTMGDRAATEHPRQYLARLATLLGVKPRMVVAMMTGADIRKAGYATARRGDLTVGAWCTAGCSNALRIGDPATARTHAARHDKSGLGGEPAAVSGGDGRSAGDGDRSARGGGP